jgi:hypothetical protein
MRKINNFTLITCLALFSSFANAKSLKQYPYISGDVLFQAQADYVSSTKKDDVSKENAFLYAESNINLNINKNWKAKTQWRLQPNDVLTTRDNNNLERYRTFLSNDRGMNFDENGLLIEELKIEFENEDLRAFAGKFDPSFGTSWRKSKRIGVFAAQMTEDYNLREKLGAGVTALLENSSITVSGFKNDNTALSRSVLNDRGRLNNNRGIAGNSGFFSSYAITMEGENFLTIDNLFYNLGYRSLGVGDNVDDSKREQGYVFGAEYLHEITANSAIIPLIELVRINNFTGEKNRDATYATLAVIGKYSNWTSSISFIKREIKQQRQSDINDRQLQFSVGYKFSDNFTIDVSRADIKENGFKGSLLGITASYLYKF